MFEDFEPEHSELAVRLRSAELLGGSMTAAGSPKSSTVSSRGIEAKGAVALEQWNQPHGSRKLEIDAKATAEQTQAGTDVLASELDVPFSTADVEALLAECRSRWGSSAEKDSDPSEAALKLAILEKILAAGSSSASLCLAGIGNFPEAAAVRGRLTGGLAPFLSNEPCFEVFMSKLDEKSVRMRSTFTSQILSSSWDGVQKERGQAAVTTAAASPPPLPTRRPRYLELKDQGDAMLHFVAWMSRYAAFGIDCEWASGDQLCLVQLSPALPVSAEGSVSDEAPLLLDVLETSCASDITTLQRNFLSFILESKAHVKVFHGGKQVS